MERTKTLPTQPNLKNCRQFWSIQLSDDGFIVLKFSGGQARGRVKWNSTWPSWLICTAYFNRWLLIIGCVALLFYLWQLSHPLFLICSYLSLSLSLSPPSSHISEQWGRIIWFWWDKYRHVQLVSDQPPPPPQGPPKKPGPQAPAMAWRSNPVCLQLQPSDLDFPIQIRNLSTIALKIQWTNSPSPSPPPPPQQTNKLESVCIVWFLRKSKINIKTNRKWDIQTQKP